MEPRREEFPEQHVYENEFSSDQQFWNQEGNSGLEQKEPEPLQVKEEQEELEPPQVKVEQEEFCISQEGEQLLVKLEADTFMVTLISEEKQQSEAEPNKSQRMMAHQCRLLDVTRKPVIKLHRIDFPEQHVCENEFSPDQQFWNQEGTSGLEQEEPEHSQVTDEQEELEPLQLKEEQEELCVSQEGEQLLVKLEADTFMVTLISEEKQQSEAEPNSEQLLSHNSAGIEIQDQEGSWHVDSVSTKEEEPKPKKRRLNTGSHHEEFQRMMEPQHRLLDVTRKPMIQLHRIVCTTWRNCLLYPDSR
ncbi:uncharacterized protein KZ484_000404 [Pholidichthys leucotaenia]